MRRSCLIGLLALAASGAADAADPRDPDIDAALAEVSAARIKARVEALAGFGTRHTLSDPTNQTRGVGAARRWIKAEFDRISAGSGGRLKVEFQSFKQAPGRRVAKETELVNVIATLPGTQPESSARTIVVSGHYDSIPSMRGEATDPNADAPGANDDASGTAVVLELAEVLSARRFDATIVFAAFVGEEQGLLGSGHFAEGAKAAGRDIEAMITNDIVGNTEGGDGRRDNQTIRVFSEGVPDSPLGVRLRAVGGENDSPSRQLARYVRETAGAYTPEFNARMVFRADRYLRGAGDHQPFLRRGYAPPSGSPSRPRTTPASTRTSAPRGASPSATSRPGSTSPTWPQSPGSMPPSSPPWPSLRRRRPGDYRSRLAGSSTTRPCPGPRRPSPTWPAMRSFKCDSTAPLIGTTPGPVVGNVTRRRLVACPRTTSNFPGVCAPSTATGTGAPSSFPTSAYLALKRTMTAGWTASGPIPGGAGRSPASSPDRPIISTAPRSPS